MSRRPRHGSARVPRCRVRRTAADGCHDGAVGCRRIEDDAMTTRNWEMTPRDAATAKLPDCR